jgi:hypothetical protein
VAEVPIASPKKKKKKKNNKQKVEEERYGPNSGGQKI